MTKTARFGFFEKVVIESDNPNYTEINHKVAAVLGKAHSENGWTYSVHIYDSPAEGWVVPEHMLVPTGEFDKRETFYDGSSIRVSPSGDLLDDPNDA